MSSVETEIAALEERLRVAELGPDPDVFEKLLADDVVLIAQDGQRYTKAQVVDAHRPGHGPKFTRVEMRNLQIVDHDTTAVVTCEGEYEGARGTFTLKFLRVWLKKNGRWQIIAGAILQ